MSWPATPLLSFIDASAPACDASFLNSLQAGVNGLCLGTYSYKAIVVDGTGGAAKTPTSGNITASGDISSATITGTTSVSAPTLTGTSSITAPYMLPSTNVLTTSPNPAITKGRLYKDLVPVALGLFTFSGPSTIALTAGYNVATVVRNTTGSYSIAFTTLVTNPTIVLSPHGYSFGYAGSVASTGFTAAFITDTGAAADVSFAMVVYGT